MNILITDDQPRRYGRLIAALGPVGIQRDQIDTAVSASQARERLAERQYDLLILDILLPNWPDGEPDAQNALDLLFELHEGDELHRPDRILGITADAGAAERAAAEFTALTWTIVQYSPTDDDWVNRSLACIRYMQDRRADVNPRPPGADVVVVCALQKPELEEVLRLPWTWDTEPGLMPDGTFVHRGSFCDDTGRRITVAAAHAPRMGMVSSAILTAGLIERLQPRLVVMTGICAGVRGKVNLGDVLLADPAWDIQSGKRMRDGENAAFAVRPHHLPAPQRVRKLLQELQRRQSDLLDISASFGAELPGQTRVIAGPVGSGSAVLADGDSIQDVRSRQHDELIGIEMEIYGVYAAAAAAAEPQPRAFALKGVCDFADPNKEDGAQAYAAYASANVLRVLLQRFGTALLA